MFIVSIEYIGGDEILTVSYTKVFLNRKSWGITFLLSYLPQIMNVVVPLMPNLAQ